MTVLCRLAVRAGHRDACRMFCCLHPDLFEEQPPLKPFKLYGTRVVFYGYYYPSRYKAFLNKEQQAFCHSIYEFKEGEIHGIKFFKSCMNALQWMPILFISCLCRAAMSSNMPSGLSGWIGISVPIVQSDIRTIWCWCVRASWMFARSHWSREPHPWTELPNFRGYKRERSYHRWRCADYRAKYERLQEGDRAVRWQGGSCHFLWQDYHYAASADCQVGGMGRLYYPLFQIKLVFFTVGLL